MPNLLDLLGNQQENSSGIDLQALAPLLALMQQQNQPQGIPTANIGGQNILVKRGSNRLARIGSAGNEALMNLMQGVGGMQQMQKRNQFLQGVQQITQEQSTPDEKINKLMGLMAQHGSDYGLGLKDIVAMYGQQATRQGAYGSPLATGEVPEGMEITGFDQKGQPMIRRKQPSLFEKETAKTAAKIQQSKITSQYNLNLTTEAARDLSEWLVKGYKEGGAGTRYGAMATKVAAGGWLPPKIASKFASSGAIVGKRNEVLMKMFPMLTQQIGKEGSVRLIESVIQRIGQTLPDTFTPPSLAKEQLASTIQSLYRISRAINNLDLSGLKNSNVNQFAEQIAQEIMQVPIAPDEQQILDNLINAALEPLDKYLGTIRGGKQTPTQTIKKVGRFIIEAQ